MMSIKKIACMMLALMMVFSLTGAFAADDGSIQVNNCKANATYSVYRLLDLESFSGSAYAYKVNTKWSAFFASEAAQEFFTVDAQGYATWTYDHGIAEGTENYETLVQAANRAAAAEFAQIALAYAKTNSLEAEASAKSEGGESISFTGLPLGYYLLDSTIGALCSLNTTDKDAEVNDKNLIPTIDKDVKQNGEWEKESTAAIGDIVEYRGTVNVEAGAQDYVFHDNMGAGLTYQSVSEIEYVIKSADGTETTETLAADYYTVVPNAAHQVVVDGEETTKTCTFDVVFENEVFDLPEDGETLEKFYIYYTAILNENAIISPNSNVNTAELEYGDDNFTEEKTTDTDTFAFDIVKTDENDAFINGAEFKIYDALTGGNEIAVVKLDAVDGIDQYRHAMTGETGVTIVVTNGIVRVSGFDAGTYYLEETKQPDGYNKLPARVAFTVGDEEESENGNRYALYEEGENGAQIYEPGTGVQVINKSGVVLPETGGVGTTLFYLIGGALAVAAVVLLVTKKRMGSEG